MESDPAMDGAQKKSRAIHGNPDEPGDDLGTHDRGRSLVYCGLVGAHLRFEPHPMTLRAVER